MVTTKSKKMTRKPSKVTVEVRERIMSHATSETYWNGIVTTAQGYCYFCTWTGDKPSEETVLKAWQEDRKAFDPYNSMTEGR